MKHLIQIMFAAAPIAALPIHATPVDGQIDPSFGDQGTRTLSFTYPGTNVDYAHSLMVASDGKIIVVGTAAPDNSFEGFVTIARLLPDGQPDTAFGANGQIVLDIAPGSSYGIGHALLDAQDRILLVGSMLNTTLNHLEPLVCRVLANGSLDPSYGTAGSGCITVPFINSAGAEFNGGALTSDGSLIVVGDNTMTGTSQYRGTFVKINATGIVDTSFAGIGGVGFGCGTTMGCILNSVAISPGGRIVGVGYVLTSATTTQFEVIALTADGALDTTFNGIGGISYGFQLVPSGENDQAAGVAMGPDGCIAVVGYAGIPAQGTSQAGIVEFAADGAVNFSTPLYLGAQSATVSVASAATYTEDGKLMVGGTTLLTPTSNLSGALVRLRSQGQVDPDFGNGFGALVQFNSLFHDDLIAAVAFEGTQLLVAGEAAQDSPVSAVEAVARLTSDTVFANSFE